MILTLVVITILVTVCWLAMLIGVVSGHYFEGGLRVMGIRSGFVGS
jgi:hypothetical protein